MAILQDSKSSVGLNSVKNLATKNKITDTVVPIWDLAVASAKIPDHSESFAATNPGQESVVGEGDERVLVSPEHFAPGGKYRSIVKIFSVFKKPNGERVEMHGTGWLIRPDLMVTAGHCTFDWGHSLGPVVEIKAYIGYNGKGSVTDPKAKVQFRSGKRVATTLEWVTTKGQRKFDVGFVQLDSPFTDVKPWKFDETPLSGSYQIGVVGYPGDLSDKRTKEMGAQMYEMFMHTDYHLAESHLQMLQYQIDTAGGNSGSPVIRESDQVSIGVHVYGGDPNSASVIGQYGNPMLDYVAAFDLRALNAPAPVASFSSGVSCYYYSVPTSKTPDVIPGPVDLASGAYSKFTTQQGFIQGVSQQTGFQQGGFQSTSTQQTGAQQTGTQQTSSQSSSKSFARPTAASRGRSTNGTTPTQSPGPYTTVHSLSVPNQPPLSEESFWEIFKPAISIGGPLLAAVGGPLGGLASVALSAAGNMAQAHGAEGALSTDSPNLLTVPEGTVERAVMAEAALRALLDMDQQTLEEEGFIDVMKSVVNKIGPIVKKTAPKVLDVIGPAALRLAVEALKTNKGSGAEGAYAEPVRGPIVRLPNLPTTGQDAFVARLSAATESDAEGFLSGLGGFAMSAFKKAAPVLINAASSGLQNLISKAESDIVGPEPAPMEVMDGIWQRAVVAEAALQAVLQAPQDMLEEEGFFGDLAKHFKAVAPVIIKHAPAVISSVAPVVKGILGRQESAFGADAPIRTVRKSRSGASLRSGAAGGVQSQIWGHAKAVHTGTHAVY